MIGFLRIRQQAVLCVCALVFALMAVVPTRAFDNAGVQVATNKVLLDSLFDQLKDAKTEAVARGVADRIWQQWFLSDNADVAPLMERVRFAQRAGLPEEALKELDKIIQLDPDYVEGWNQRATLLFVLGRDAESVRDIQQVLRIEPRHFGALAGLGLIHMRAENWKSAIAAFERAIELHPFLSERAFLPELRRKLEGTKL